MKLSITPSNPEQSLQHSVVVEDKTRDDLSLEELTDLFRYALRGMGFCEKNIDEILPYPGGELTLEKLNQHATKLGHPEWPENQETK